MPLLTVGGTQIALPAYARIDLAFTTTTTVPTVAVGSIFVYTVQGHYIEVPLQAFAVFGTSNAVAARAVFLSIVDAGGAQIAQAPAGATQGASATLVYTFTTSATQAYGPIGSALVVPMSPIAIYPGGRVLIEATNEQADDQFTSVSLVTLRVPTGTIGPEPVAEPLIATPVTL